MNELTPQEMALLVSSAIGCSITAMAAVLPHMPQTEREAIVSQAKRLNAVQAKDISMKGGDRNGL